MATVSTIDGILDEILPSVLSTHFPEIKNVSNEQRRALNGIVNRKDTFAILPTGHGKSLIFQLLPDICKELSLRGLAYPRNAIVVVVCPLKSLVDSHIRELTTRGFRATSLSVNEVDDEGISRGYYSFIFASPELLLENPKWRAMFQTEVYQKNLFAFVADEAHVVPKWGYNSLSVSKKEHVAAFRKCFSRLGELRSLGPYKPQAPMLALTATANKETQSLIIKSLCLKSDCVKVYVSPYRKNIYLYKCKVTTDIEKTFQWLVDMVRKCSISLPKTIVYCKSIKDCGRLFTFFKTELGNNSYYPANEPNASQNLLLGMYHHATPEKQQSRVLQSFYEENGTCRLIFATNALGMGVNFPAVRMVIHFGPPRGMEELVQEIGRAGRDGQRAEAFLLYSGHHLKNCDDSVKDYCRSTSGCLRQLMLKEFDGEANFDGHKHDCCSQCHTGCVCNGSDVCDFSVPSLSMDTSHLPQQKARHVTKEQKTLLKELLEDYQLHVSSGLLSYLNVECTTAFSHCLVKMVLKHCKWIFTRKYILDNLPVFKSAHANDILCMMEDVFEDIEPCELKEAQSVSSEDVAPSKYYDLEYGSMYEELVDNYCDENDNVLSDEDDEALWYD